MAATRNLRDPRHHPGRAELAHRREQRDLVADEHVERLRELAAEDDSGVDLVVACGGLFDEGSMSSARSGSPGP